jgi:NAD(P)-dependent dehydrogenase (short-subunit alcohol dehydrogenase family)
MARFTNKVVAITGAASGIGAATTHLFAQEGARVIASDTSPTLADSFAGNDAVVTMKGDAGREEDVLAMFALAASRFGGVDIVCANAGVTGGEAGLFDQSVESWEQVLRINLIGPFLAVRHGAKTMQDRGRTGAIAFLASDEASYVNGHALVVDAGLSTSRPFARPSALGETIF